MSLSLAYFHYHSNQYVYVKLKRYHIRDEQRVGYYSNKTHYRKTEVCNKEQELFLLALLACKQNIDSNEVRTRDLLCTRQT